MSAQSPFTMCRSVRHTPAPPTLTITSSGPWIVGSGMSSIFGSSRYACTRTAFTWTPLRTPVDCGRRYGSPTRDTGLTLRQFRSRTRGCRQWPEHRVVARPGVRPTGGDLRIAVRRRRDADAPVLVPFVVAEPAQQRHGIADGDHLSECARRPAGQQRGVAPSGVADLAGDRGGPGPPDRVPGLQGPRRLPGLQRAVDEQG